MKRKKYRSIITMITIFIFLSWLSEKNIPLSAQAGDGIDSIAKQHIQHLFIQLRKADNDTIKLRINEEIKLQLSKILKDDKSFNDALDSLTLLGKLYAPDTTFRILNWNVALSEGTYLYTLILQIHDTVTGETQVRVLEKNRLKEPVYQIADSLVLSPEHWYGALYYDILQTRTDTGTCYTLLGLDFNDLFTSRKVVDVLWFDKEGTPFFGLPVFHYEDYTGYRAVFEFSAHVSMLLRFDPDLNMIIFDHLSPSHPDYEGIYQFYGPDFSYDGFVWENDRWVIRRDIDVRNTQ